MRFNRRDANEREIVDALKRCGCVVDRVERRPYDLVVGRGGLTYLLELKYGKGPLTDSQKLFESTWKGHWAVVRTVQEALRAVGMIA